MYGKNPFCLRLLSDHYKVKLLYFITEITFLNVRHTSVSYFSSLLYGTMLTDWYVLGLLVTVGQKRFNAFSFSLL